MTIQKGLTGEALRTYSSPSTRTKAPLIDCYFTISWGSQQCASEKAGVPGDSSCWYSRMTFTCTWSIRDTVVGNALANVISCLHINNQCKVKSGRDPLKYPSMVSYRRPALAWTQYSHNFGHT